MPPSANHGPPTAPGPDNSAPLEAQRGVVSQLAANTQELPAGFTEAAADYAAWRHGVFRDVASRGARGLRFRMENCALFQGLHDGESGVVVVLAHTGCWFAVPFALHEQGVSFTFLMETADQQLLERYAEIGLDPIQVEPGVTLVRRDGAKIHIPGASSIQRANEALERGLTVGFFGDTPRSSGYPIRLLGQRLRVINHYALVSVRSGRSLVALRQWTDGGEIHIRFERLAPPSGLTGRTDRVRYLVERFAKILHADLRARPHQYAYFPEGLFGSRTDA